MTDPAAGEAHNALERALVAAMADPAARPAFYRTLLESEVYFITPPEGARPADQLVLVSFQGAGGRFTPMFSSRARVDAALGDRAREFDVLGLGGRDAFRALASSQDVVVLNPGQAGLSKPFPPEEVRALAEDRLEAAEHVLPAGRQVMLAQAKEPPTALIDALRAAAAGLPTVEALYLAQLHDPASGEPPHPVVGVAAADVRAVVGTLSIAAGVSSLPVDFVSMQGAAEANGIVGYLLKVEPFYRRA